MNDLPLMLELLDKKRVFFLLYEKEMEAIPLLSADELEACVERGGAIIEQIRALEARLEKLVRQNGPLAASVVNNECDRGALSPELGKLYDASLSVKAVASRIVKNDSLIRERLAYEREMALEGIKEVNKRAASVAGRYKQSARTGARSMAETTGRDV